MTGLILILITALFFPAIVSPIESISQFVLLAIVVALCFYQPLFLSVLINQSISIFF